MHEGEVEVDDDLARRLVDTQFPVWRDLPLARVASYGTDHAIYRLGDGLSVRFPRIGWATEQADKEAEWLPRLAPHLPVELPLQVALGEPADGYPWRWSVNRWLDGTNAELGGSPELADDLAAFLRALRALDRAGAPEPKGRGLPLAGFDTALRERLPDLRPDEVDVDAVADLWAESVAAPVWDGPPTWLHGDLQVGNLLLRGGRLKGVIDWGAAAAGDPAVDLMAGWTIFDAVARPAFRAATEADDASWLRARGWATMSAVMALPYYRDTNPGMVREARWRFAQVLS
jgi:aminoglycoside phosphotransferase (APT) family kinase protein